MKNLIKNSLWALVAIVTVLMLNSCINDGQFDPIEANSIPDATPPSSSFVYSQGSGDVDAWKIYTFANTSTSATTYAWDFGDGSSSTEVDPVHTFSGEGSYTVTLTASDKLDVVSTDSQVIEVVQPPVPAALLPNILEAGFEDNSLPDGTGDGRDSWRTSLGGVIQITSSPVNSGSQAAKFPSAGDRVAYQELKLSANTDYILTYYYTMKTSGTGSLTVSVLGGSITDLSQVAGATLANYVGTDQTDANAYVRVDIPFNTGANETIAILIINEGVECRVDDFSLALP
ncbi:PKD domain-containing protein [Lutibacter sp.]|uniref:PKD domain-containing protein n=1 Tax=Lutibacter sp. TaxID=1925666 RepID=UPI0025C04FBF|nr:PKD domain-containing protein [Lutibacter sp.]MCF6181278.1 PKD domain-containing protein [Lutibacter sp.]